MIEVAFRRKFSEVVAGLRLVTGEQGKTDRGWQGKRPAVGPGLCGWLCGRIWSRQRRPLLAHSDFVERNQSCERRRPKAQGGFAP
jgi:hypothetical protein